MSSLSRDAGVLLSPGLSTITCAVLVIDNVVFTLDIDTVVCRPLINFSEVFHTAAQVLPYKQS